jgi:hypothetical protein
MKKIKSGKDILKPLLTFCGCVFLCILILTFSRESAQAQSDPPYVLSTSPADGTTNVSVNLKSVSVTFNKKMAAFSSYSVSSLAWGQGPTSWSNDFKILTIPNYSENPLPDGIVLKFTLSNMKDAEGNFLNHPGFPDGKYEFSFTVGTVVQDPPFVVSTSPQNGTTGVSRSLERVIVEFNKAMDTRYINMSSNFPSFETTWSHDQKSLFITRTNLDNRLSPGYTYNFILNPFDGANFRDTQGNILPMTTFSFTIVEEYDFELIKVPANPGKGFEWPYYFAVPHELSNPTVLLVETNNTGTWSDDQSVHDTAALELLRQRSDFAIKLDVPLLVPTFPRPINPQAPEPGGIYTHALDRYSLLTKALLTGGSIERIDLQLIAMIRDAQQKLKTMGYIVDSKIFMMGFSASGAFTSRFTAIHPYMIRAAAPGSPGGWPLAPVANWQGRRLGYAVGIADLAELTGKPFDLATFRKVPQYIYVGNMDRNDALDIRGLPEDEKDAICLWLDCRPEPYISDRWPKAQEIYESVQAKARFVIYPGVAHTITPELFEDIRNFFASHKPEEIQTSPKALPGVLKLLLDD